MYLKLKHFSIYAILLIVNDCTSVPIQNFAPLHININNAKCNVSGQIWTGEGCHYTNMQGPCKDEEFLVLDKENYIKNEVLKPVCVKMNCSNYVEVWWSKLGSCISYESAKTRFCDHLDLRVSLNLFGEGVCACWDNQQGIFKDKNNCYDYYTRGPCEKGEVVVYDISTGYAKCKQDQCLQENGNHTFDEEKTSNVTYAPRDGTGECHVLRTRGPCDSESSYEIDGAFHVPNCVYKTEGISLSGIGTKDLCHIKDGKCKESVIVKESGWDD